MVASPPPPWSEILPEIVVLVLSHLPTHVDRVRFAVVCRKWRHASQQAKITPPLPLLAIPDGTVYNRPGSKSFHISGCIGYTSACGNWLVFSSEDGNFLKDPLSNMTMKLPSTSRVRAQYVNDEEPMDEMIPSEISIITLIFASSSLVAALVSFQWRIRIAVCKPGAASWWSVHMGHKFVCCFDSAFYQGMLYVLNFVDHSLFAIDISVDHETGDPWVSRIEHVIEGTPTYSSSSVDSYLVESRGKLLMVHRIVSSQDGQTKFEVFEACLEQLRWTKITSIGDDQVLFLRRWCCRSVCISHYNLPGDQIVFFDENYGDDCLTLTNERKGCCSVYDMRDGKVSTLLPVKSWMHRSAPATWLFPEA